MPNGPTTSAIGLSTYSFFWQWHETAPRPLTLPGIVAKTASWGVDLLQLCDYPALDGYDAAQAADLGAVGRDLGVAYELGTRGLDTAHLLHYLELAGRLDVTLVRSMVKREEVDDAPELLAKVFPAYEDAGVTLALETYEQVADPDPRRPGRRASAPPTLGICLDPANVVAAPRDTRGRRRPDRAPTSATCTSRTSRSPARTAGSGSPTAAARSARACSTTPTCSSSRPPARARHQPDRRALAALAGRQPRPPCRTEDDWTRTTFDYLRSRPSTITEHCRRLRTSPSPSSAPAARWACASPTTSRRTTRRPLRRELPRRPAAHASTPGREVTDLPTPSPTPTSSSSPSPTSRSGRSPREVVPADEARHDRADARPGRRLRGPALPRATTSTTPSLTPATRRSSCSAQTQEECADTFGGIAAPQDASPPRVR